VLHDLGWFASISVAGAALFALVLLPQMFFEGLRNTQPTVLSSFIDRFGKIRFERKPALIAILGLITLASLFFFTKAGFETDMKTLNFVEPSLRKAGEDLEKLSSGKFKNVYIIATGRNREEALRTNERIQIRLTVLMDKGIISSVSGIRTLLLSDSLARVRLDKWNSYWTSEKSRLIIAEVNQSAAKCGFKPDAFDGFGNLLEKSYRIMDQDNKARFESSLFSEWLDDQPGLIMITSIAKVKPSNLDAVYKQFCSLQDVVIFDRQKLTDRFVERVRSDFSRLVMLSMIFVSLLLWISFGRIELALITAIPMYLSWLITLGFMGATGIRFNIFNIIVSSFIFGLGVDYSILIMRGIMQDYKYRSDQLFSYKVAILLSSATTLFGVAALFTARHPALNSIALVSVFGIAILVMISFTIQPLVAGWFLTDRLRKNTFPITARIFVKTFITWGNIVFIAVILAVSGSLMYFLLPVKRVWKEKVFHKMFCGLSRLYIFLVFPDRKLYNPYKEDFNKPAVIISNHQSLIETPAMLRLSPKIIILTTTWVYNSPVFGPVARLASFYNVDHGLDSIMDKLREKVSQGYSILVFPEAHRSKGNIIQRFHRGAFYLAEQLKLDILPLMMFGSGDFLERGAFWGRPNMFRQKIYQRITPDDKVYGTTYQERTKAIRKFYILEYARFRVEEGTPSYYHRRLVLGYIYKGPILEWYLKVKLRLEKNYKLLDQWVPRQGEILDLGCGYGFVAYMLALTSGERIITGVDYDKDKIAVATGSFLKTPYINFETADIGNYDFTPKDCIILSDVLHYLPLPDQETLLVKCMEKLKPAGVIIIRDADTSRKKGHSRSKLTEFLSTGIKFNKTYDDTKSLHYISTRIMERITGQEGFSLEIIGSKKYSSNTYYLLKRDSRCCGFDGNRRFPLPGQTGEYPPEEIKNIGRG
jgi:1-acyl-sn-glycerol-3-phosphate acyltransferase